jgi:hypothetical protein
MSRESLTEKLNIAATISAGSVIVAAAFIDFVQPSGADLTNDIPVLEQLGEHAGNVSISGLFAFISVKAIKLAEKKFGGFSRAKRIVGTGALALALGAGGNSIPDTQVGMDHIGQYIYDCGNEDPADDGRFCTVDSGDLVWGTVSSGILAVALTDWRKQRSR